MDRTIQEYLRATAAQGRDTERIGPFLATFSRSSANPFLNYAIPDEGANPTADHVRQLIAAYQARGRTPRLEYIADYAPRAEATLLDAGFTLEGRLALMVCWPGEQRSLPLPQDIELLQPATDEEFLAVRTVQHEAYGEPRPAGPEYARGVRTNLESGGMAVLARVEESCEPVGAGEYTPPRNGLTEFTSFAVRAPFRRRGIAAAITSWLLTNAFDRGITLPFLMANEPEERVYARAGFTTISRIVHISHHSKRQELG